jgi:hypothetical protein
MIGRPPKLSPRESDRLVFLYTIGVPRAQLAQMFGLSLRVVGAYIRGEHKNHARRA